MRLRRRWVALSLVVVAATGCSFQAGPRVDGEVTSVKDDDVKFDIEVDEKPME